jgi:hypothetical protein
MYTYGNTYLYIDLQEEGEPEAEVHVTVTHLHQKKKRCCFNLFLILLAMLELVFVASPLSIKEKKQRLVGSKSG